MTQQSDAVLAKIRAGKVKAPSKKEWVAPDKAKFEFRWGVFLAFDQTLGNTGWSLIESQGLEIYVRQTGHLKSHIATKGTVGTLEKAAWMGDAIEDVVSGFARSCMWRCDGVIYEMPAVQGYRLESSLMAAREVLRSCERWSFRSHMVSNQKMQALLLPQEKRNSKSEVKRAVERLVDKRPLGGPWNEHVSDSVALGLTYIHKSYQKEEMHDQPE